MKTSTGSLHLGQLRRTAKLSLLPLVLFISAGRLVAQGNGTLPGLYLTNVAVLSNGVAQFVVHTPNASNGCALLVSLDSAQWSYWRALNSGSNAYLVQSPGPITNFNTILIRAAPLGQSIPSMHFSFRRLWNGPLANGTAAVSWPQPLQGWQATFDFDNSTNLLQAADVSISGPPAGAFTNISVDADFWDTYAATYQSDILPASPPPVGGTWNVQYGATTLNLSLPDPQIASHQAVIVPSIVASNGLLYQLSWSYRDPNTGASLGGTPGFVTNASVSIYGGDETRYGLDDYIIYDGPTLPRGVTNVLFNPPIEWTNSMLAMQYVDTLNNPYQFQYSFGNRYEVYGGSAFSLAVQNWWDQGYNPPAYGFTYLGSATNTATFAGAYNVYIIRAPKHNGVKVDTAQGSNGLFYSPFAAGNTDDVGNVGGPQDGAFATVGDGGIGARGYYTGGFIVIDATGAGLNSLKVYIDP